MKPFDLEAAERGEPITTRDGRNVRFVGHVPEAREDAQLIVSISGDDLPRLFHQDGKFYGKPDSELDLFMGTRTVYVNLYSHGTACWHASKEDAERGANAAFDNIGSFPLHTAVPVEL